MSDGQVVGTISIKVTPDTKHFRRELKAELEAVTKEIEGSVKVNADFDANGLKEKVAAAAKAAKAEIPVKADLKGLDLFQKRMLADLAKAHKGLETKIPIDVDGESLRRTTAQIVKDLENETKRKLPLDLELATGQRAKILAEVEAIKKLAAVEPIKLKLDPEKDFRLHQRVNAITPKVKPELDESAFAKALAEARAQAKLAGVKLDVDFRDKGAELHLAELIAKLKAEAKLAKIKIDVDVDRNVVKRTIGSAVGSAVSEFGKTLGSGFRALSDDTTLIAAAVFTLGAPALALFSGLLVSLPAIIAGVAAPIGALVLGFEGIKKAAEDAGLIGENKKGKSTLAGVLKDLKESLSGTFQKGFAPIFEKLTTLAPVVADGLKPIAERLVDMARGITDVVTSSAGMAAIKNTFDNIANAMAVATPGMQRFAEGFLNLVSGGSNGLSGFAGLFTKLGTSFDDWVKKITTKDWWGTSPIDRAIGNFKDILGQLFDVLGEIGSQAFQWMQDPTFVNNMKTFIGDFKDLIKVLLPGLKDFFNDLAGAIHDIDSLVKNIGNLTPPSWLKDVINKPTPEQAKGNQNATGKNSFFPGFLPEAKDNLLNLLGFANLPALITNFFGTDIANAISQGWNNLMSGGILNGLASSFQLEFQQTLGQIDLTGAFSSLFSTIGSSLQAQWDNTVGQINFSSIGDTVSNAFSGVYQTVSTEMGNTLSVVLTVGSDIINFFTELPGKIVGAMGSLGGALVSAGKSLMDGLLSGIKSGLQAVLDFASGIAAKIAAVKGPLPKDRTTLTPAGQALMQGLQDGIEGGLDGVLNRASQIATQISDVMRTGLIPPGLKDDLKREMDELRLEYDQLKVQKDALDPKDKATKPQRDTLTDQMRQVQTIRDQLKLQSDQLGFSEKYGENQDNITQQFGQQLSKLKDIGFGFAQANISQLQSDLGMSGHGAVEGLAQAGIGWLSQTLGGLITGAFGGNGQGGVQIQVNSVDEALQARQNLINRQALGVAGR